VRAIDELMDGSTALRGLASAAAARGALVARVREALPAELAPHCVAATLADRELHLLADAASWATRLRYLSRELTRELRRAGLALTGITVRVLPADPRPAATRHSRRVQPSASVPRCLDDAAAGIADPALRAALLRLGRRLRR